MIYINYYNKLLSVGKSELSIVGRPRGIQFQFQKSDTIEREKYNQGWNLGLIVYCEVSANDPSNDFSLLMY